MRTTLTLDEDVAQQVKRLMRERGTGFKETVNELLRRGLRSDAAPAPYETPTFSLGALPGIDLDKTNALLAQMDEEDFLRKREMGK